MEECKGASSPEKLLDQLQLSDQKSSETGPKDEQDPQNTEHGCTPSSAKDATTDESFHDCHDSFEAKEPVLDDEGNLQNEENSSRKQTELDEEYLLELEKDMPEEEKQVIQSTSVECKMTRQCLNSAYELFVSHKSGPLKLTSFIVLNVSF